ncbi:MAG TPA: carboxypeptidase-like regulatory domain-containing protein, partial [Dyella sp.]
MALAIGLSLALGMTGAMAQSITGGVYGKEPAGSDVTVTIDGVATGYHKELHPEADGHYSLNGLNPGRYKVTVSQGGNVAGSREVMVTPNVQTPVASFTASATAASMPPLHAADLSGISVTASTIHSDIVPIDVSTPQLTSNYSMALVNQLPTGRSLESIALLKSNVRYDNQTTGKVQMGGASPSENRYYFNEFDTTNDYNGLGATILPSEALSSVQTLSSNATTTWTSSTGGVMAATVRQGTNKFESGYSLYFTPPTSRLLNPRSRDSYDSEGNYYHFYSENRHDANITSQYLWASGALVKDKLFFFAMLGNGPDNNSQSTTQTFQTYTNTRDKNALLNLTWNITNNQSLNVVGYRDWKDTFNNQYSLTRDYDASSAGKYFGWNAAHVKDQFLIGNYNWQINDAMSLRLMA